LMVTAATRAKMCERLARALGVKDPDPFFTMGLFSVLDALLDMPLPKALNLLSLSKDVQDALLKREGIPGTVLKCVLAYERGNWDDVTCANLDNESIRDAYLDAVEWTRDLVSGLSL